MSHSIRPWKPRSPRSAHEALLRGLSVLDRYGRCKHCGVGWRFREPVDAIPYETDPPATTPGGAVIGPEWTRAATPVCQRCFDDELDADDVTSYFRWMWHSDWDRPTNVSVYTTFRQYAIARKNGERYPGHREAVESSRGPLDDWAGDSND